MGITVTLADVHRRFAERDALAGLSLDVAVVLPQPEGPSRATKLPTASAR